jgi:hypothetical protein
MFAQDDLAPQLDRLRSPEEWTPKGQGLFFLFPKARVGKCVSRPVAKHFSPGNVVILNRGQAGNVFPLNTQILNGAKPYPASAPLAAQCLRLISVILPQSGLDAWIGNSANSRGVNAEPDRTRTAVPSEPLIAMEEALCPPPRLPNGVELQWRSAEARSIGQRQKLKTDG